MKECEFIKTCPIFERFRVEGLKNFYIRNFCQGKKLEHCERLTLRNEGQDVPITLLPTGKTLETLEK